jgi:hypothetical protein
MLKIPSKGIRKLKRELGAPRKRPRRKNNGGQCFHDTSLCSNHPDTIDLKNKILSGKEEFRRCKTYHKKVEAGKDIIKHDINCHDWLKDQLDFERSRYKNLTNLLWRNKFVTKNSFSGQIRTMWLLELYFRLLVSV